MFLVLALPTLNHAKDKTLKLKAISQRLRLLESKQQTDKKKQQSIDLKLRQVDLAINHIHLNLKKIHTKEQENQQTLKSLNSDIHALKKTLEAQQKRLTHQLTLHYQLGQYPYLKLILNQQNPALISRLMVYLGYLNQARLMTIKELLNTKKNLVQKETILNEHIKKLQQLTNDKHQEEASLMAERNNQTVLIKQLNQRLSNRETKIKEVKNDRAKLLSLIALIRKKQFNEKNLHFEKMRKQLPWPAKGRLTNHFNREHEGITYHGIIIKAREGNNIRAIYPGKVAFSGWLNGYGLILIISHGHGYMSLYANNQTLYRQRGDIVAKGDVIATLGHSGGQLDDGLYFEIRHNGKPISPLAWLK